MGRESIGKIEKTWYNTGRKRGDAYEKTSCRIVRKTKCRKIYVI